MMAASFIPAEPARKAEAAASTPQLLALGPARFEPGYWQGMRQAAVLVPLRLTRLEVSAAAMRRFDEVIAAACPLQADTAGVIGLAVADHPVLGRLLRMTLAVLQTMGMPVVGGATAVKPEAQNPRHWLVGLPAIAASNPAPQAAFVLDRPKIQQPVDASHEMISGDVILDTEPVKQRLLNLLPTHHRLILRPV